MKQRLLHIRCCTRCQNACLHTSAAPLLVLVPPQACHQALLHVITLFLIQVTVSSCDLLVVSVGQMSMSRAINITQKLWTAGITAEIMCDWSQVIRQTAPVNGAQTVPASMAIVFHHVGFSDSLRLQLLPVLLSHGRSNKSPHT